ncbi:uncharacterized protein LOC130891852 [Diorhabda carinulata]|uniref:uncharacterized protein LOC130891852 n=1 Tax=Diorhabda carinulata TaxID=1163345 RepID=UPI0025A28AC0|nr:uncharacterized protein LOC130891852 [Diorhabda carinulata]XP_057652873.1 uncharacterized protein LOC130891852 [Diorhabda carinulata]
MVLRSFCTAIFLLTSVYLLFSHKFSVSSAATNKDVHQRRVSRHNNIDRYSKYPRYNRIKADPFINGFILDDDEFLEFPKRQSSDDYGHLRFGRKNGEDISDDYGHMRFGRSDSDRK